MQLKLNLKDMEIYEKKQALTELGSYRPAFMMMRLSFPFPSSEQGVNELSDSNLSVFIHEYVHFLQDISSYCLLNNAYYYSEYLHTAVNHIYTIPGRYFEIPLRMPRNKGNVDANEFINKTCFGSNEEIDTLIITKIKSHSEPFPYQGVGLKCIDNRILCTAKHGEIHFGYLAVMESMAYILESKISRPQSSPCDFPYMSAQLVTEHVYPEFGGDVLNILALCDVSLQFSNPGNVFFGMLEQMRDRAWLPNKPEDVYDYVYSQNACVMGRDMPPYKALTEMSMTVERCVQSYVKDMAISASYQDFVHNLLRYGLCLRLAEPYFMLDLARGGYARKNRQLIRIMGYTGMPIIEDSLHTFHTILPNGWTSSDALLEVFPAIEQIHKCLHDGADICEMIDFCEDSEKLYEEGRLDDPAPIVNDNCLESPWKRCFNKRLCPYALLWKHWNLSRWQPIRRKKRT